MWKYIGSFAARVLAIQGAGLVQHPLVEPSSADPTATVEAGTIIGTSTVVATASVTVNKYLGVPFAVTPPERFSPPQAATSLDSPWVAQAYKPACFQQFRASTAANKAGKIAFSKAVFGGTPSNPPESEDCLYLNIFSPDTPDKMKPVLFWIFGGALTFGHAGQDLYDGSSLAANQDVVVVTINYRTNVFGFSNSPAISIDQLNAGFYDQRLALQWVHDNIASFGGDPAKVTLFGQSAGAKSADRIVLNPPDTEQFHAAILQSDVATYGSDDEPSPAPWNSLTRAVGCSNTNSSEELACMRSLEASQIHDAVQQGGWWFLAYTDGITKLDTPVNRSQRQKVPIMLGTTANEARVFEVGQSNFAQFIKTLYPDSVKFQNILTEYYAPGVIPGINTDYDAIAVLMTERDYQCTISYTAAASSAAHHATWRYIFNASFDNTNFDEALAQYGYSGTNLQAFHTSEIAYVFGNLPESATTAQIQLSSYMQNAWASFARDPHSTGPGWAQSKHGMMLLGGPDSGATKILDTAGTSNLDQRCRLWCKHIFNPDSDDWC